MLGHKEERREAETPTTSSPAGPPELGTESRLPPWPPKGPWATRAPVGPGMGGGESSAPSPPSQQNRMAGQPALLGETVGEDPPTCLPLSASDSGILKT